MSNINDPNKVEENLNYIVEANPTKEFFIYMITRDIEPEPAIAELIDNAYDGAKRIRQKGDFDGLKIEINYDKEHFSIKDNCGGIDLETARKYAFQFGRSSKRAVEKGLYTGLFGIGMKRSLFKLGKRFKITSTTLTERFIIEIDVDEWLKSEDWKFEMSDVITDAHFDESECGTLIEITRLCPDQVRAFSNIAFENNLISYLEKHRSVDIGKDILVTLNGTALASFTESLYEDEVIHSYKSYYKDDDGEIRIVAGITEYGDPSKAGWYVFCNGRLLLYADKTFVTGWRDKYKAFHNDMACFRGYVFFESEELLQLPWNTTKTGVDMTNRLYAVALDSMTRAVKQISQGIKKLGNSDREKNIDDILNELSPKSITIDYAYVHGIVENKDFDIDVEEQVEKQVRVTFYIDADKYEEIKVRTDAQNAKELGEKIFEYYCEMEGV